MMREAFRPNFWGEFFGSFFARSKNERKKINYAGYSLMIRILLWLACIKIPAFAGMTSNDEIYNFSQATNPENPNN